VAARRSPEAVTTRWQAAPPAGNGSLAGNASQPGIGRPSGSGGQAGRRPTAHGPVRGGQARGRGRSGPPRGIVWARGIPVTPATAAGLVMIGVLVLFCYAGPLVYHANLTKVNLLLGNRPPGAGHPLGTDGNGLDVLGLLMAGGQISLEVGVAAGLLAALIGSGWGAVAGYVGGPLDALMMRVVDAAVAIPTLVLLLLLSAIYTPSPGVLVLVIAATSWLSTAYLVRGAALTLRSREYVQAVRLMGGGRIRAIVRHIAPNALSVITVNVSFQVADAILALATLSYLGLGVRPPASDWGDMVAGGVRYIYDGYWWEIYPAGVAIIVAVVAFNLLGDGLRDGLAGPGQIR
jgi:peptide/nickel transport system permease protein